jgi:hypothetical protein
MSKVTDATTASGADGTWFKVAEDGYNAATKTWGDVRSSPSTRNKSLTTLDAPECQLWQARLRGSI